MDPLMGQIILWSVPWVPRGWALCDGSLLSIAQNSALFALLGTTYGGDGVNTFALPDLRGKVSVGSQNMAAVGVTSGAPTATTVAAGAGAVTIGVNNLPAHSHTATFTPAPAGSTVQIAIPADSTAGDNNVPSTALVPGKGMAGNFTAKVYSSGTPDTTLKPFPVNVPAGPGTVTNDNTGGGQPLPVAINVPVTVSTLQPGLALSFIIAVEGIFPSRP